MAFNKAPIKRFNEEAGCGPPSTRYTPKPEPPPKGAIAFEAYSGRKDPKIDCNGEFRVPEPVTPGRSRRTVRSTSKPNSRSNSNRSRSKSNSIASSTSIANLASLEDHESIQGLQTERDQANEETNALKVQADAMSASIEELQIELNSTKASLDEHINSIRILEAEKNQAEQDLQESKGQNKQLMQETEKLKLQAAGQVETMNSTIDELSKELNQTQAAFAEQTQGLQNERDQAKEENTALKVQAITMSASIEELQIELNSTRASFNELVNSFKILDIENKKINQLLEESKGQNMQLMQETETLKLQADVQLEAMNSTIEELQKELNCAQASLDEYHKSIQGLQNERDQAKEETNALKVQANTMSVSNEELQIELNSTRASFNELMNSFQVLNTENKKINQLFQESKEQSRQLMLETETLKLQAAGEAEAMNSTIDELRKELNRTQAAFAEQTQGLQNERDQAKEENNALKVQADAMSASTDELQIELNSTRASFNELGNSFQILDTENKKINQLFQESLQLQMQMMQETETVKTQAAGQVEAMNSTIDELSKELNQTRAAFAEQTQGLQNERDQAKEETNALKVQADAMSVSIEELQNELNSTRASFNELRNSFQVLETEKNQIEQDLQESKGQNIQLMLETETLKLQAAGEAEAMNSTIDELSKELTRTQASLTEYHNSIQGLQNERDQAKEETNALKVQADTMSASIEELQIELNNTKDSLSQRLNSIQFLEAEKNQTEQVLQESREQNLQLIEQTNALQIQADAMSVSIEELQIELNSTKASLDEHINSIRILETEKNQIEQDLQESKGQNYQLMLETETLKLQAAGEAKAMNSTIDELSKELTRTQASLAEYQNSIQGLQNERDQAKEETNALKVQADTMSVSIEELQIELNNTNASLNERLNGLQILEAENNKTNQLLQESLQLQMQLMQETETVKAQAAGQVEAMSSTIEELQKELNQTQASLTEYHNSIQGLQNERDQAKEETNALKVQANTMSVSIEELQIELDSTRASFNELGNSFKILDTENKKVNQLFQECKGQNKQLTQETETLKLQADVQLEAMNSTIDELRKEVNRTQAALAEHRSSTQGLQNERDQAKEAQSKSEAALKEVQERWKKERSSFSKLFEENETLKIENVRLAEDYAHLMGHSNHRQKIHHVLNLKNENQAFKKENDDLRSRLAKLLSENTSLQKTLAKSGNATSRFDRSQAFKHNENRNSEPYIPESGDVRGANSRETFVVMKSAAPPAPVTMHVLADKTTAHGMAFEVNFDEKENAQ